jgi:hypothetical protein
MSPQLTPDQTQQLIGLAKSQMALCSEQMDVIYERWISGKLDRTSYEAKLKTWEDRYFDAEFELKKLEK